jgi:hypothetical protein
MGEAELTRKRDELLAPFAVCLERNQSRRRWFSREQLNIWSSFNADSSVVDGRSGRTHCRFYAAEVTAQSWSLLCRCGNDTTLVVCAVTAEY